MDLSRTERMFQDGLLGRSNDILAQVRGNAREGVDVMFGIYRNAYWARLAESLGIDFPGLKALMGDVAFDQLARAYVAQYPSRHPSIRWVGRQLSEFLRSEPAYRGDPWLADMARFDWALAHAFDAADAPAAGIADLANVPPEFWGGIRLTFHPTLDAFAVTTPVDEARPALIEGAMPAIDRTARVERALFAWRIDLDVKFRPADLLEFACLEAMRLGATFGDICELTARQMDEETATIRAAQILQGWLEWGLVAGVEHDGAGSAV